MSIPLSFSFAGTLSYAPFSGSPVLPVPINVSGSYTTKSDDKYELIGAVTKAIDFGGVAAAGAKAILVFYDAGSASVMLQFGAENFELKAGSGFLYLNVNPTAGPLAANLISTSNASLRVVVLG